MSYTYKFYDQYGLYYITSTVHQWIDVFTRKEYKDILVDSIRFCQEKKGLKVYAWVIMSNHIHLIVSSDKNKLSDIIRDFKKFTSGQIIRAIEANPQESRKSWLLWLLRKNGQNWFWEEGYHGEEIFSQDFYNTKMNYVHMNPVRAGIVEKEEECLYSSCGDHYGTRKGMIELSLD